MNLEIGTHCSYCKGKFPEPTGYPCYCSRCYEAAHPNDRLKLSCYVLVHSIEASWGPLVETEYEGYHGNCPSRLSFFRRNNQNLDLGEFFEFDFTGVLEDINLMHLIISHELEKTIIVWPEDLKQCEFRLREFVTECLKRYRVQRVMIPQILRAFEKLMPEPIIIKRTAYYVQDSGQQFEKPKDPRTVFSEHVVYSYYDPHQNQFFKSHLTREEAVKWWPVVWRENYFKYAKQLCLLSSDELDEHLSYWTNLGEKEKIHG